MPSKKARFQLESPTACVFCGKEENDEFLYGKYIHTKTLSVHQNCLFFASGLSQRGRKESQGILGFFISDIQKEVLRGKKLTCFHCKKKGATVGCCKNICRRTFHFPCGIQNHSLHQFFGCFSSFCQLHKPLQKRIKTLKRELYCHICFLSLSAKDLNHCLYSTCCNRSLFHRTCLQKYALSAGRHFFKCPLCNNSSDFMKEMEFYGISVPEKDASWELEENAYQDLLFRPECGADDCLCADGRKYNGKGMWALLPCSYCGADARHQSCANLDDETWACNDCKFLGDQISEKRLSSHDDLETTENTKHLDSINQQIPALVIKQSNVSAPSCSNIASNNIPFLSAEIDDLESLSIDDSMAESDKLTLCDKASSSDVIPSKVPPIFNEMVESEDIGSQNCSSLKREIASQEPYYNNKKMCFLDNFFIKMTKEKMRCEPSFILNSNSVKNSTPNCHSKVKKGKAIKKCKPECCSDDSQQCIKKMFGLQCHKYQI